MTPLVTPPPIPQSKATHSMSSDFALFGPILGIAIELPVLIKCIPTASTTSEGVCVLGITVPKRYERQAEMNDTSAA